MALHFVLGNSGGGKTHYLYETLIRLSSEFAARKYIIIVPDQFTMETQRDLVDLHPGHSIGNIDILSFSRLAYRIFEEMGKSERVVLDDTAKNLMIRRIVEKVSPDLEILKGNLRRMGYIDELKSFISELMVYGVTPDDLVRMADETTSVNLRLKLSDIEVIYQEFMDLIGDENITQEGVLAEAGILAADSHILDGCCIAFDGFTGFTPVQLQFIEKLMRRASDVYVTATIDENTDPFRVPGKENLFYMSTRMITQMCQIAESVGMETDAPVYMTGGSMYRYVNAPALYHLEQNIFRGAAGRAQITNNEITIASLQNPKDEMVYVARQIRDLMRLGYKPGDFAVVSGDAVMYENYARTVFKEYGIQVFLDQTHNLVFHPFVDAIRAIMQIVAEDFSYRSVFGYLRSGYSSLEVNDIDILENYIIATGIRGYSKWSAKWNRHPYKLDDDTLSHINDIRTLFMSELGNVYEVLSDKESTASDMTAALYNFILERGMGESLLSRESEFEMDGDLVRSKEYSQIYRIVLQIFEKFNEILGDEIVSIDEYRELMEAGFTSASLGVVPMRSDAVVVGDIERTRLNHIKVLFFVGVNDGIIPGAGSEGGILSEQERELLLDRGESIAYGARDNALLQNFYLYLNLTKPQERLYLTYARTSSDGSAIRKSFLIDSVSRLFDGLGIVNIPAYDDETLSDLGSIYTPESTFGPFITELRCFADRDNALAAPDDTFKNMLGWYASNDEYSFDVGRLLDSAFTHNSDKRISKEAAAGIYGESLRGSISRLEKYAQCPYSYFMQYGLQLGEREKFSFESRDLGNIYHTAIDILTTEIDKRHKSIRTISDAELMELTDIAMDAAINESDNDALFDSNRSSYMAEKIRRVFARTVNTVAYQMRAGGYDIVAHERKFLRTYDLGDGLGSMELTGKIDRIDEATVELGNRQQIMVRIVDYKSSEKDLELSKFYYGLSLQLIMYMNAAVKESSRRHKGMDIIPGGMLYYGMTDKAVDAELDISDEKLEQEILKKHKMKGYINRDNNNLRAMDTAASDGGLSDVVPFGFKKDGDFNSASRVLSTDEINMLQDYADRISVKMGRDIASGCINISPYEDTNSNGCKYCSFKSNCGFDKAVPGYRYRRVDKLTNEDVFRNIAGEDDEDSESNN